MELIAHHLPQVSLLLQAYIYSHVEWEQWQNLAFCVAQDDDVIK